MNDDAIGLWNIISDTYNTTIPKSIMEKVNRIFNDVITGKEDLRYFKDMEKRFPEFPKDDFIEEDEFKI